MRPRNYGVLNRSIARGVTYALRENDRKKRNAKRNSNFYLNSSVKQNNNNTIDPDKVRNYKYNVMNDFKELGLNFLEYEDLLEAKNIDK